MSTKLPLTAVAALHAGNKIQAIKLTREATNLGLKEAKDQVDTYLANNPSIQAQLQAAQLRAGGSFLSWLVMMVLVVATIVYFWPR